MSNKNAISDYFDDGNDPLNIILSSFTANVLNLSGVNPVTTVSLNWVTASVNGISGFHMLEKFRQDHKIRKSPLPPLQSENICITLDMIPATNTSTMQTYSFMSIDAIYDVSDSATFNYWLQII